MKHKMLLDYLSKYGNLSLTECEIIKQYFIPLEIKKRNRLIKKIIIVTNFFL